MGEKDYIPDWTEQPTPHDEPEEKPCPLCGGENDTGKKYCSDCYHEMSLEQD